MGWPTCVGAGCRGHGRGLQNHHLRPTLTRSAGWPNPWQVVFSANGHYVRLIHPLPLPMEPPGSIYDFEANKSVELMDLPLLLAGQ